VSSAKSPGKGDATLDRWRHHWQDEADAAFLYERLAEGEPTAERRSVYRRLAEVERRHVASWRDLLVAQGFELPDPRPSLRARLLAWLGRRFGPSVPVTAFKGLTGYLGAATAVVEVVLALAALRAGVGPAVAARIDPALDGAPGLVAGRPASIAGRGSEAVCLSWSWTGQAAAVAVRAATP